MAATASQVELDTPAVSFRLPATDGRTYSLDDVGGKNGTVIVFICNHCPYVKHVRQGLADLARDYREKGAAIVAISANDAFAYPDDNPANMAREKAAAGYVFPYLHDESQDVAQAYQAACTPDFYVFDGDRKLVYRGQMDDSRPGNNISVTGKDLRAALDAVIGGQSVSKQQKPSIGCNIKWKPGQAPKY